MVKHIARDSTACTLWCCLLACCAAGASARATGAEGFISPGSVAVYDGALIKFIGATTGRTLGFANVAKYMNGPSDGYIASSPDARYVFLLKHDFIARKLSVVVVGIGATQITPLGELAIPKSFFSDACSPYPKNFGVTQQQAASGARSYRLFVTLGCAAPSSAPTCPKNTPIGMNGGVRGVVFRTMALTYHLGAGGKLGLLRTGPVAVLPLPLAQECSYQDPFNTQTYKNRHLIAALYPIKGVINEGVAIFEASLSSTTSAGKATEVLTYTRTYLADTSAYDEVFDATPATPTSVFALANPSKTAPRQVYYLAAGLVEPYYGGIKDDGGNLTYSFNINSGSGVAFSIIYNNTNPAGPALLQRTSLAELKAHSKGKILATFGFLGDATVLGSA